MYEEDMFILGSKAVSKISSVKQGFSLIELLVVVAIIGILAAVGVTGYQVYIAQTRDATTVDNFEFLKRTLDQDILSLENDLNARSEFAVGLTSTSQCFELRDNYITDINGIRNNPFNETKGQVCDGNHFTSHENEEAGSTVGTVTLTRGQTMVYCDGIDVQTASWKRVNDNLGLKFCTCSGQEECETTSRYAGVAGANFSANGNFVQISINTPTKTTITPNARLLIGNQIVDMDHGTANLSGASHLIEARLLLDVTAGDTIYEVNGNICFTPPGESTKALYMADFSGLDVSNELPARHRCY